MFRIETSPWQIVFPFTHMKCPSLNFMITFGWKLILFNIRIATPACLLLPFAQEIIFYPFSLRVHSLSFSLCSVSCMQQNAGSCLYIQPIGLCFIILELNPCMLRDIEGMWLLLPLCFLIRSGIILRVSFLGGVV